MCADCLREKLAAEASAEGKHLKVRVNPGGDVDFFKCPDPNFDIRGMSPDDPFWPQTHAGWMTYFPERNLCR